MLLRMWLQPWLELCLVGVVYCAVVKGDEWFVLEGMKGEGCLWTRFYLDCGIGDVEFPWFALRLEVPVATPLAAVWSERRW